MKPETAYKFIKRFTLTNTTIMTILFVTACDSLWHAFCIMATLPVLGIGMERNLFLRSTESPLPSGSRSSSRS